MNRAVVDQIVAMEWEMYKKSAEINGTSNVDGDKPIFCVMRSSQFSEWSDAAAESYLADLTKATAENRNLTVEKNIRMMKIYAPEQYEQVKGRLDPISAEKEALVNEVSDLMIVQMEELHKKYPHISTGQSLRSTDDTQEIFSTETYQKGEFMTFSEATLLALKAHILDLASKGEYLAENIIAGSLKIYGYKSLEEADKAIEKSRREACSPNIDPDGCNCGRDW